MTDDGLGLIISTDHEQTINSLAQVSLSFCAGETPSDWESPQEPWNQGSTSSCAGHAGAANFTHRQSVETGELIKYSPWFSYITSQRRGGFTGDHGTSIRSVIDSATRDGCCLESLCPRPNGYSTNLSPAALADAAAHKHHGLPVDLRDFETLMAWLFDRRSAVIGTQWHSGQDAIRGRVIERLTDGRGGAFRGYHARALIGHRDGLPVVLNSHGDGWGLNGKAVIERELWDWWKQDSAFVALGFTDISEREPKRRDWSLVDVLGGSTGGLV